MIILISFGTCLTPKLSKCITLLPFTNKAIQCVPIDLNSLRFVTYDSPFILGNLFLGKTTLNLG